MTKQGAKTTLLFVGTATVIVLSIYVSSKQRRLSRAAARAAPPSTPESGVSEGVAGGPVRPRVEELGARVHGFMGNLADLPKRVTGETERVVARLKLGKESLSLPDIDLTSPSPEPTREPSPESHP